MNRLLDKPLAGVMIPLFSIRAARYKRHGPLDGVSVGWGIGEILDLIPFIDFMSDTGLSILQLLPINEMATHETSPYNALSAFAFDPIYLALDDWEDFRNSPEACAICTGEGPFQRSPSTQSPEGAPDFSRWDKSPTVCYEAIRAFKNRIFRIVFEQFKNAEGHGGGSHRADAFKLFMENEADWLNDYALFRCLQKRWGPVWINWPMPFRKRYPLALSQFSEEAQDDLLFIKYLQWACWEQWMQVKNYARDKNVLLMGDLPFLVSSNSADVWQHQKLFRLAIEGGGADVIGAPPDDFNPCGQAWGFPLFCWDTLEQSEFAWWRQRMRKEAAYYDILRLDHIVGFFRVWVFPHEGVPHFEPADDVSQVEQGRIFLRVLLSEARSCLLVGEDLGIVPPFVHAEMHHLGMPGMKILRWQKKEERVIPPKEYPALSLATTGTHDMSSLAVWWNGISHEERSDFLNALNTPGSDPMPAAPFSTAIQQHILQSLLGARSKIVIFPFQDIVGGGEQINFPGILSDQNWRYRMPDNIEVMGHHPGYKDKFRFLKSMIEQSGR